ncbi:hypothetical protein [Arthrobacter sp. JSM 101049]|uniref:hypothetical protein n=1 Tax=Arthrobacter sp. JSM 101049 TaxID=929097 RepID=UPI00356639A4
MTPIDEAARPTGTGPSGPPAADDPQPGAGTHDGFFEHFPEAVAAGARDDGTIVPSGGPAVGFRVVLYSALAIGAVAGLSLIAAWVLQAVLTGSYIRSGRDYFGSGLEAAAARELLSIPVGGFVAVLLVCLAGMCIGAWGIQRSRKA